MYKIIGADQKEYGPVSAEEIRRWVAEGRANAQTLLQADGQSDWRPLSTFPEFAAPAPAAFTPPAPGVDAARLVSGPATALLVKAFCVSWRRCFRWLPIFWGLVRKAGPTCRRSGVNLPK